jgi:hypothetical protein
MVAETRDRQLEGRRLAKRSGRTRYQAPQPLRGSSMCLVGGQRLREVPGHGFYELADAGAHSGNPHAASAAHRQLLDAGFRVLEDGEPGRDVMKLALRRPIAGDRALIAFLNRNAASQ